MSLRVITAAAHFEIDVRRYLYFHRVNGHHQHSLSILIGRCLSGSLVGLRMRLSDLKDIDVG